MRICCVATLVGFLFLVAACRPITPDAAHQNGRVSAILTPSVQTAPTSTPISTSTPTSISTPTPMPAIVAPPTPAPIDPQLVEAGKKAYLRNYCGSCHTLAAAGTRGVFAPAHDQAATVALQRIADPRYAGKATTAAEYLLESLLEPNIYLAPGATGSRTAMPAFSHLNQDELESIVYFLLQQK
jgi:mono/diheme cytochrome c family protein